MVTENERIKYLNPSFWIRIVTRKFSGLNSRLLQISVSELQDYAPETVYQAAAAWIIELLQFGLAAAAAYVMLFRLGGLPRVVLLPFTLGLFRWVILSFVRDIMEAVRGK